MLARALDILDRFLPALSALSQASNSNSAKAREALNQCDPQKAIQKIEEALASIAQEDPSSKDLAYLRNALIYLQAYPAAADVPEFYRSFVNSVARGSSSDPQSAISPNDCEQLDANWLGVFPDAGPAFACFRNQLLNSIGENRNKALLRTALADFLFNYKSSKQYPESFLPENLSASAQTLDNLFNPIIVEFNRDIAVYVRFQQYKINQDRRKVNGLDYVSDGLVTVRVVSANRQLFRLLRKVPFLCRRHFQSKTS